MDCYTGAGGAALGAIALPLAAVAGTLAHQAFSYVGAGIKDPRVAAAVTGEQAIWGIGADSPFAREAQMQAGGSLADAAASASAQLEGAGIFGAAVIFWIGIA